MKTLLRSLVASFLAVLARSIVKKYEPTIVMVTGSVGKTSTKDAVAAALSERYFLRASEKSYNSEFGVPLTIIGARNPWENATAWLKVIQEALTLILLPNHYPKLLVLEVGADRPGDLAKILAIATPDAVVVTRLPEVPVHVEAYAGPQAVREEEFRPAYALASGCPLIISADDDYARDMAKRLSANVIRVGYAEDADVLIQTPQFTKEGMKATVVSCGKKHTITAAHALGRTQLYAPAMALALASTLHLTADEALEGLSKYSPPPGRARILKGRRDSVLIDDSYNASPAAVEEALSALSEMPASRRIVAIGDMLELGRYSVSEHERMGVLVARHADMLVTVGSRAAALRASAIACGMDESKTWGFETSIEAAHALLEEVSEGDVILIKGSQGVRMERITEVLLQDPGDVRHLVRQDKEWKKR
jgi:UDP-N-acetylmuramoyl-tripeptide--D-alanyl-D-alanine ligase